MPDEFGEEALLTDGDDEDWEEEEPLMLTGRDCQLLTMMRGLRSTL